MTTPDDLTSTRAAIEAAERAFSGDTRCSRGGGQTCAKCNDGAECSVCYTHRHGRVLLAEVRRLTADRDRWRVSAVLLAASVAGVEAGLGVVRGVLGEWTNDHGYWVRVLRIGRDVGIGGVTVNDSGWCVPTSRIDPRQCDYGSETGPEGRAAADAALLRLGYAYLDPAAPFGIVVPFNLENER